MNATATMTDASRAASLLNWWQDMGVDTLIDETPVPWLERLKAKAPVQVKADALVAPASLPTTLPAFTDWLAKSSDIPEGGPPARRIVASGVPSAELMIVVDMPGLGDVDAGQILSGEIGKMFDRMLGSIHWSRTTTYVVPLCPTLVPTSMIAESSLARLGEIALHHIALARPKQVWLMGDAVSRAILGMDMMKARGVLHRINQHNGSIEAVVSFSPRFLFQNPRRKGDAWADMQLLQKGTEA
jgi:uracil-DNA glycosylase